MNRSRQVIHVEHRKMQNQVMKTMHVVNALVHVFVYMDQRNLLF